MILGRMLWRILKTYWQMCTVRKVVKRMEERASEFMISDGEREQWGSGPMQEEPMALQNAKERAVQNGPCCFLGCQKREEWEWMESKEWFPLAMSGPADRKGCWCPHLEKYQVSKSGNQDTVTYSHRAREPGMRWG